ncbi:MAG TPA: TIGR01244 family sulfur transferase [Sphingobium sp.]|uniref:TIGR01244 family sulfur transferase n=1 Tax=Sphingobium sp. TaxID=1912891 RepID=UPI002ECFE54E
MLIALTEKLYVAPQISVDTVTEAAGLGVSLIINNRPEGESADQTPGDTIEAAAKAEGLAYSAIPVTHAGFAPWQIDALDEALNGLGDGKALLYCRSGTRSTLLWALSRARAGDDVETVGQTARSAGYDIASIRQIMDALAAEAGK